MSRIISSGVMLTLGIPVTALFLLWAFHVPILHAVNVLEALLSDGGPALLIVRVAVSLRTSAGCVLQVLAGMQRLDLKHKMLIVASALEFAVAITLLLFGWDLWAWSWVTWWARRLRSYWCGCSAVACARSSESPWARGA